MEIIPLINIKNGYCARMSQGRFTYETVYDNNPIAVARRWVELGATRLQIVDLDGARAGQPVHIDVIGSITRAIHVPVQVGGGLRTASDVKQTLALGVSRVILGTAAVRQPDLLADLVECHGDSIIVSVDARDGRAATGGWVETAPVLAVDLIEQVTELGARRIIYTDISRGGAFSEPSHTSIAALVRPGGPAIIASSGVASIPYLQELASIGVEAAVVGRALYNGDIRLPEAQRALDQWYSLNEWPHHNEELRSREIP